MCDPPSMLWQPTISREIEYLPSEICGMGAASAGFAVSLCASAPNTCVAANAAGIAAAKLEKVAAILLGRGDRTFL